MPHQNKRGKSKKSSERKKRLKDKMSHADNTDPKSFKTLKHFLSFINPFLL
jgi:hypothetical protein